MSAETKKSKTWLAVVLIVLACAVIAVLAYFLFGKDNGDQKPTETERETETETEPEITDLSPDVQVGDFVNFGPYVWRVIDKQEGQAFLITEEVIACEKYNGILTSVTWEKCDLRAWLNTVFLAEFSAAEQSTIVTTTVKNEHNKNYGTVGGRTTKDKIFLLSIDEADRYFHSGMERRCVPNEAALAKDVRTESISPKNGKDTCCWWLRSPAATSIYAAAVAYDGFVYASAKVDSVHIGVRPVLWVELNP